MAYETRTYRVQFIAEIGMTCGTELGRWTDTLEAEIFDTKEAAEQYLVQHPDTIPEDRSWKHLTVRHKNSYHELRVRCSEKLIINGIHSDEVSPAQQFDDSAVSRFALAMKLKLSQGRDKGRNGWHDPVLCSNEFLANMFLEHVTKSNSGNFVDLANICMMLHERGANPNSISEANESRLVQVVQRNLHHVLGKALKDVKRDFPLDPPPEEDEPEIDDREPYDGAITEGTRFIGGPFPDSDYKVVVAALEKGTGKNAQRAIVFDCEDGVRRRFAESIFRAQYRLETYQGPIEKGMAFIWEPTKPKARCKIEVIRIEAETEHREGRVLSQIIDSVVDPAWNDVSRFREAVVPMQEGEA